jgi:DNA polymerase-3 subunit epsilon
MSKDIIEVPTAPDEEVQDSGLCPLVGVLTHRVLAINPTIEELETIGIDYFRDEPKYLDKDKNGMKYTRMVFWLLCVEDGKITPVTIPVYHDQWESTNGKKQFIDGKGWTVWAKDQESIQNVNPYIDPASAIPAGRNLNMFVNLVKSWLNLRNTDTMFSAEIYRQIKINDMSKFRDLVEKHSVRQFKCLCGITIGEYEGKPVYNRIIYNKFFLRHNGDWAEMKSFVESNKEFHKFEHPKGEVLFSYQAEVFDPEKFKKVRSVDVISEECILIVDVETIKHKKDAHLGIGVKEKLAEIGVVELNLKTGARRIILDTLCKPDDWDIESYKDSWIFENGEGLTVEMIDKAPYISEILPDLQKLVDGYPLGITAFNNKFDFTAFESAGLKIDNKLACIMLTATNICKIPGKFPGKFKWPNVEEAWKFFFPQEPYTELHRGADDAFHEGRIAHQLFRMGKLPVPKYKPDGKTEMDEDDLPF